MADRNHARYLAFLTDDHLGRLHIALDLAVDLQDARPMIFSPWPMILRSLPITDFSLVSVPAALKAPLPPLATDVASCIGAAAELRVNVDFPRLH